MCPQTQQFLFVSLSVGHFPLEHGHIFGVNPSFNGHISETWFMLVPAWKLASKAQSLRWRHAMSLMRRASSALLEADMNTLTLMTGGTSGPRAGDGRKDQRF
jgi:hypothetical protein